jgi:predicted nucleic acid-binding protein
MIILDTNIVSELMRETPDARVAHWLSRQKPLQFALTTITIAEIQRGLKRLPNGKRRSTLERNFAGFVERGFEGRVLPFDMASAMIYGEVCALRESAGLHADPLDLMIAAIAKRAQASLATRNIGDFEGCGIKLINPWQSSPG